ncbi:cytochrome c oxidase assembly protein [Georgenia alba]|uniref:Cytochrome c oxidase assembly protein n=1 Tax=Georgenia alba TaxID=2233858 RepID=A0ABW2Q326_9MICO
MPEKTTTAARTWPWAAGAFPALLLAVVLGLAATGGAAPTMVDPGPVVRWGVPLASGVADGAAAVTVGAFALCALALPRHFVAGDSRRRTTAEGRAWPAAARIGAVAATVWALSQLVHLILSYGAIAGTIGGPGFGAQLLQFVTDIELGRDLMWTTVLSAVVALVAAGAGGYASAALTGVLALVALVPLALTGHASGAASHTLAVSGWWLHAAGVCLWVGGLVVLVAVGRLLGSDLREATARFSAIALWAYVAVAFSGVINAWIRLSTPLELLTHPYGRLLAVKIALTVALGAAGWAHRRVTLPAIGRSSDFAFWRLAGVEVLLMAATTGAGAALGSSAPPVPQEPITDASPTYLLTGYAVPPYPTAITYLTQTRLEPVLFFGTVAAVVVYLRWVVRLRRRGDSWPVVRTLAWLAGWLLFAWVTNGGPVVYGSVLFSAHMLMHMLLAMVVPILVVIGAPVTLAVRALPHRRDGSRGPREWLLALVHSRPARFLAHPAVAAVNFAGSLVLFYYTAIFEVALTTHVGHLLMVIHFTVTGYLFANALIGVDPGPSRPSYPLRLLLLLATMGFHAFFGVSLLSQSTLLAADYFGWLGLPWGVDALADQTRGGAITWGIGELPTVALAIGVAVAWAKDDTRAARRADRRADRDDDAELRAYNAMLAERARRDGESTA